jgi:putative ABC transport system permease protein
MPMIQDEVTPLSKKPIIDEQVIARIKGYVYDKHPDLGSAEKAALLANALHRVIEGHLPDFNEQTKASLRRQLLTRMGMTQRFTLMTEDILETCLALDLERSGILEQLAAWINKTMGIIVSEDRLRELSQDSLHFTPAERWKALSLPVDKKDSILQSEPLGQGLRLPKLITFIRLCSVIVLLCFILVNDSQWKKQAVLNPMANPYDYLIHQEKITLPILILPQEYSFIELNLDDLRVWLQHKKSLLAEEPYFTAIVNAAQDSNIHPLLLFAITGQEQAFVPKDNKYAKLIANNPFNVHSSWKTYNTTIKDSAHIAAETILHISEDRPINLHPIAWLNTQYAEDPHWWIGVTSIFEQMRREIKVARLSEPHEE